MPAESGSANFTPSSVLKGDVLKDAAAVRMLVLDVDGVCTDGKLYMDGEGHAVKCFHAHDGIGIKLALRADLGIAVITGRNDPSVHARMTQLGVRHYFPGFEAKMPALRRLADRVYAVSYAPAYSQWRYAVEAKTLEENFKAIINRWSMSEN